MDTVELKPTRLWSRGTVEVALFEDVRQGPAFAELVNGRWAPDDKVPAVWLPSAGNLKPRLTVGDWLVRQGTRFEVLSPAIYAERYEPAGGEVASLESIAGTLPDPVDFRRRVLEAARRSYADAVDGQEVHTVEDTFEVQRMLAKTRELARQYASTFTAVDKALAEFQRDQLELLPAGPGAVKIPDAEGDVTVQLDQTNSYSFDEEQLSSVIAAEMMPPDMLLHLINLIEDAQDEHQQLNDVAAWLAEMITSVIGRVRSLGNVTVQVTKVRAFADQLARDGQLGLSGVVRDAIIKTTTTKPGAKFTRKEAK
jgi:hypothetical protein